MKPEIALLLFSASFAHAAAVTSSTTCTIYSGEYESVLSTISGESNCGIEDFGARPAARTHYSAVYGSTTASLSVAADSIATGALYQLPGEEGPRFGSSTARTDIDVGFIVGSVGPQRLGLFRYSIDPSASLSYGGMASVSLLSPYFNAGCTPDYPNTVNCYSNGQPAFFGAPIEGEVQVQLGRHFNVAFEASSYAQGDSIGGGLAGAGMTLQYSFFELDGVTPVENAPEPASFFLAGSALVAICYRVRKLKTSTSGPQRRLP